MATMIEAMARAMAAHTTRNGEPGLFERHWDAVGDQLIAMTRAALTAAREPTEAMISAGGDAGGIINAVGICNAQAAWSAMIDAILAEGA